MEKSIQERKKKCIPDNRIIKSIGRIKHGDLHCPFSEILSETIIYGKELS